MLLAGKKFEDLPTGDVYMAAEKANTSTGHITEQEFARRMYKIYAEPITA